MTDKPRRMVGQAKRITYDENGRPKSVYAHAAPPEPLRSSVTMADWLARPKPRPLLARLFRVRA